MPTRIVTPGAIASPLPGTPIASGAPYYRATFSAGDMPSIVGSTTASWEGLKVGTWEGTVNLLAVSSGRLVRGSAGSGFNGLPIPDGAGVEMSWLIVKLPTVTAVQLDIYRAGPAGQDSYRVELNLDGNARLNQRVGGAITGLTGWFKVAAGDRVGVRHLNGRLSLLINGAVVSAVIVSAVPQTGQVGVAVASGTGFELDNPEIDVY